MEEPGIIPSDIGEQLRSSYEEGFTQSEIMLRTNCHRKWYFRYILRAKKQGTFSWALLFGEAVHRMLKGYYDDPLGFDCVCNYFVFEEDVILTPSQIEEYRHWRKLAEIMVERHNFYWRLVDAKMTVLSTEQFMETEYRGFRLLGKVDMQVYPSSRLPCPSPLTPIYILDHKTTYLFDKSMFDGWNFRFQFLYYAWLYWKVTGTQPKGLVINAIRKPALRRSVSKQETPDEFLRRIEQDIIERPEEYFKREKLAFDKHTLDRFQKYTLDPVLTQFEWIQRVPHHPENLDLQALLLGMNSDYCHMYNKPCEFLDLCQNNFKDFSVEYTRREVKHEELRL